MAEDTPTRAALLALLRRIEEVGIRPGTDLADAVDAARAALAATPEDVTQRRP